MVPSHQSCYQQSRNVYFHNVIQILMRINKPQTRSHSVGLSSPMNTLLEHAKLGDLTHSVLSLLPPLDQAAIMQLGVGVNAIAIG